MRKAFTLVELLILLGVIALLGVILSGVFATFISDIPKTTRLLQENSTVLNLLDQMRQDMDRAVGLPGASGGRRTDDETLLIEQPEQTICYQRQEGKVVRTVQRSNEETVTANERVWSMPHAVITWRPWRRDAVAYAIEVHSHIPQEIRGKLRDKLVNSHVFFVHALGKDYAIR